MYATAAMNVPAPDRAQVGEVEQQMRELEGRIQYGNELANTLRERLSGYCSPVLQGKTGGETPQPVLCGAADRIRGMVYHQEQANGVLMQLRDTLQV